jgi:hypothetical protein
VTTRQRIAFEEHPLAAYLPPWELERISDAYLSARRAFSMRDEPTKGDRDMFLVGWVASLKAHHYAGWKGGQAP